MKDPTAAERAEINRRIRLTPLCRRDQPGVLDWPTLARRLADELAAMMPPARVFRRSFVGRQLIAAKEACEPGEFLRLFKGSANAVGEPLPFGADAAQQLMQVASNAVISNTEFVRHLPQSWGTLYELTKLDDEQIVAGIKAGEIRPPG